MRRSKFTPTQIAKILKEFDNGKSVEEISREYCLKLRIITLLNSSVLREAYN